METHLRVSLAIWDHTILLATDTIERTAP